MNGYQIYIVILTNIEATGTATVFDSLIDLVIRSAADERGSLGSILGFGVIIHQFDKEFLRSNLMSLDYVGK